MTFAILFEKIEGEDFPPGCYYAHVPSLGLTTHGLGIEGARAAADDLLRLWVADRKIRDRKIQDPGRKLPTC
jgi:predicted RNase H-like HicB family nuclease